MASGRSRAAGGATEACAAPVRDVTELRSLPLAEALAVLRAHGEPPDPRRGIDDASLRDRFSHLRQVRTTDLAIAGATGRTLSARAYVDPSAVASGCALVWVHGGAFIGGHLDMPEAHWVSLELAATGLPVLSVDYTKCLGDVHYPQPVEDIEAAWEYARIHSAQLLQVSSDRLLLGGASAGASLASSLVQGRVDAGQQVPAGLLLVYPAVHPDPVHPSTRPQTLADAGELSANYAGTDDALRDPQAFAGLGDGRGYPPTLIVGCAHDAFLPSARDFQSTLSAAGVDVLLRIEEGAQHGHLDDPFSQAARRSLRAIRGWIGSAIPTSSATEV